MNKNESFSSFIYDKTKKYYLMQKWSEDDEKNFLKLLLTDNSNYWIGNFTKNEIKKFGNLENFDLDGIKNQFNQAFNEETKSNFLIKLTQSSDFVNTNLTVKKILDKEIKVEIISVILKIVDDPAPKTEEIFDFCINKIGNLENKISHQENELKRLASERNEALQALKDCVTQKEELEYDLYSKFVEILNEKKAKIRELSQADD